ncbi:DEAH-box ATP-dependent RNA helicase prp22, partial [Coemansia sp. RSA 2531]
MSQDNELHRLEYLSLVTKVTTELSNHIGISDKDVAEYIIHLHEASKGLADFKQKLDKDDCGFSDAFVQTLHRLISTMKPKKRNEQASASNTQSAAEKASLFPGLSLPNKLESEDTQGSSASRILANDIGNNINSLVSNSREDANERGRHRSRSPTRRHHRRESSADYNRQSDSRQAGRRRHDSRSRSRSPSRRQSRWDQSRTSDRPSGSSSYRDRRSRDYDNRDRADSAMDDAPVLYKIYQGRVSNLKDFGAFVSLDGVKGRTEGMVHVSAIQRNARVGNPREVLERGQSVKVKVVSIVGSKLGLSMKDVDQGTGADLTPHLFPGMPAEPQEGVRPQNGESSRSSARQPAASVSGSNAIRLGPTKDETANGSTGTNGKGKGVSSSIKRLTSPEKWEIKQLIASGALDRADYPDLDEVDEDGMPAFEDDEEDLDIELREEEPDFLRGHTLHALQLSPVKVVKAPDGSLNRAALAGVALAKERKELKQQQAEAELDNLPKDLNRPWEDPMPAPGERNFAQDLRGVAAEVVSKSRGGDVPEWKRAVQGKTVTYGKITDLSIQDQRKSLPVYKLRDLFVEAVDTNQFLIAVGDTGSGKTTQLTQYLYEEGFARRGRIGCTQPRRVAATSVAKRVAEEVGCRLGAEVGYTIRYEDCTSPETKIKYCTEGMLI